MKVSSRAWDCQNDSRHLREWNLFFFKTSCSHVCSLSTQEDTLDIILNFIYPKVFAGYHDAAARVAFFFRLSELALCCGWAWTVMAAALGCATAPRRTNGTNWNSSTMGAERHCTNQWRFGCFTLSSNFCLRDPLGPLHLSTTLSVQSWKGRR